MLKFIGSGSAFNTKLGNNSAYYKNGNEMLLIDCGSNTFHRIKESNLLNEVEHIHVLITHTHADHVGSLADTILFSYFCHGEFAKSKVTIYSMEQTGVREILKLNGAVENLHFDFVPIKYDNIISIKGLDISITNVVETNHVSELKSFSYELKIKDKNIYYSGDTSDLHQDVLKGIHNNHLDYIFTDTCKADYEGNVHLSLRKLTELIVPEVRSKVWCMHLDEGFNRKEAEELGFNVVTNEF